MNFEKLLLEIFSIMRISFNFIKHSKDFSIFRCRLCEERFPSLVLLEYHKEDEDHWSYLTDEAETEDLNLQQAISKQHRKKRGRHFEANREIMNDMEIEETEFGPNDEDREMLVTSAA